jgi:radical SAM-linked protein
MVNRPVRERSVDELLRQADRGLTATGYNEVSLLSLSTADYRALDQLLEGLQPILEKHRASLSFPSLRPDRFTAQMAERAGAFSRTGLTFAPEAATPRLRGVINKQTSDEALLKAAELAFSKGWQVIKLYFMIGLPTETEEDVDAMVDLVREVDSIRRKTKGKQINVSLSPFSPKPHTPFQRESQISADEVRGRYTVLKEGLRRHRAVKLDLRDPEIALVETALIRGDRGVGETIAHGYRMGGVFDAWSDGFRAERWVKAFARCGIDIYRTVGAVPDDVVLPWSHINAGLSEDFLTAELKMATRRRFTPDCREGKCHYCGLQLREELPCPEIPPPPAARKTPAPLIASQPSFIQRCRLVYRRTEKAMYHSHLSVVAALERALRRLGIPLEFTRGFKPHVRLIASPPLGVGMTSRCEALEFGIGARWNTELFDRLKNALPPGIIPVEVFELAGKQPSLGSLNVFLYRLELLEGFPDAGVQDRITKMLSCGELRFVRSDRSGVRTFDARPCLWKLEAKENCLMIGVRSVGGPMPRMEEILERLLPERKHRPLAAYWRTERVGMWWTIGDKLVSPERQISVGESEMKSFEK